MKMAEKGKGRLHVSVEGWCSPCRESKEMTEKREGTTLGDRFRFLAAK